MESLSEYLNVSPELLEKVILSIGIFVFLLFARFLCNVIIRRRITDAKRAYGWRRAVLYT